MKIGMSNFRVRNRPRARCKISAKDTRTRNCNLAASYHRAKSLGEFLHWIIEVLLHVHCPEARNRHCSIVDDKGMRLTRALSLAGSESPSRRFIFKLTRNLKFKFPRLRVQVQVVRNSSSIPTSGNPSCRPVGKQNLDSWCLSASSINNELSEQYLHVSGLSWALSSRDVEVRTRTSFRIERSLSAENDTDAVADFMYVTFGLFLYTSHEAYTFSSGD